MREPASGAGGSGLGQASRPWQLVPSDGGSALGEPALLQACPGFLLESVQVTLTDNYFTERFHDIALA